MAAALDERISAAFVDMGSWAWDDEASYLGERFAPCLARYGLLPAVAASLAPRPLVLTARDAHNGQAWVRESYQALGASGNLRLLDEPTPSDLKRFLKCAETQRAARGN